MNRSLKTTPLSDRPKESLWKRLGGGALGCAILLHVAVVGLALWWSHLAMQKDIPLGPCGRGEKRFIPRDYDAGPRNSLRRKFVYALPGVSSRISGGGGSSFHSLIIIPDLPLSPNLQSPPFAFPVLAPLEETDAILKDSGD